MANEKKLPQLLTDGTGSGLYPTLNKMGYMTPDIDPVSEAFLEFAKSTRRPVLEIGAAYGNVARRALVSEVDFTANDLDPRHLDILKDSIPESQRGLLSLLPGSFPDKVDLSGKTFAAILACRVFHFFSPDHLRQSLKKIYEILDPGGKVFIIADTIYLKPRIKYGSHKIYEKRIEEGAEWPGLFEDLYELNPAAKSHLPPMMHYLDPIVLRRELHLQGFDVELSEWRDRPDYPENLRANGKENVVAIGVKRVKHP